eukprot:4852745-Amphidinium_carterae.1
MGSLSISKVGQKSVSNGAGVLATLSAKAKTLNNLGRSYADLEDFEAAETSYRRALAIYKGARGERTQGTCR